MIKKKMSLRAQNFDSSPIKVNDKLGNPIMIGGVLVWKVENTLTNQALKWMITKISLKCKVNRQ
jgi:hypothetical protein